LKKLIIIQCFLICLGSFAQEKWSLDRCIDYALTHNLQLKDLNYTSKSSKETYRQSIRELLPSVSASSGYDIQFGRSVDPNTNVIVSTDFFSNNYSINANLDLFQGFQKLNTITATKFLYKAAKEEALHEKYLLAFRVMTAFYDVQFFKELVAISEEQVAISSKNYQLVKKQIELGIKAGTDLYEAESTLVADQLNKTQSENSLNAAKLNLIQEMNLENTTEIRINLNSDILEGAPEETIDGNDIYQSALSFIPIIKGRSLRVKAAEKDIAVARGNLYPSLSVAAGYGTGFFETNIDDAGEVIPFSTQIEDNASQFIGFSLRIPISQRWSSRSRIKQRKIALMRAANDLKIQKQELSQVIWELIQNYKASLSEYEQTKQSENTRLLAFKVAQKRYEKGLLNVIELNQSKNMYATAQNENLQVKLKLKVQRKTLDFYKGLPVFNIEKTN